VGANTGGKRGDDRRVELAALNGLLKDLDRRVGGHRGSVGPRDAQGLIPIGHCDDADLERDLRRLQAIGIAAPVEMLVMRTDDRQEPRERAEWRPGMAPRRRAVPAAWSSR